MEIEFQLSGLGNTELEKKIINSVKSAGYSEQELSDIRHPAQYNLYDSICDFDKIKKRLINLQQNPSLMPNIVIPKKYFNIKYIIKKILAKFFKWYIDPIIESQSVFNNEALTLFSDAIFLIQIQKEEIIRLKNELGKIREKSV